MPARAQLSGSTNRTTTPKIANGIAITWPTKDVIRLASR